MYKKNISLFDLSGLVFGMLGALASTSVHAGIITFEELPVNASGFYNGDSGVGTNSNGWTSGEVFFNNTYESSFGGFWNGWSYSSVANSTTAGVGNQYAAWPGGGSSGNGVAIGGKYAVAYGSEFSPTYFNLPSGARLQSVDLANSTYAGLSMRDGDGVAKKFGGPTGNDPDFLRVTLTGYDALGAGGNPIGSLTVNLADFTSANNTNDFIQSDWRNVDLSALTNARSVGLSFTSSDIGTFGVNTPTYVAMDNLNFTVAAVPEPTGPFVLGMIVLGTVFARSRGRNAKFWTIVAAKADCRD